MGKNAKLKEKPKWSHEKPQLDNARKLRRIYFIDPEDKEFTETIKNARKKLETPVAPAMPCKIIKNNKNCGSGASNIIKTRLACIWEASKSTRLRMEESLPNHHEDQKVKIHYSITIWYTNLLPMPQAMKIPAAKAAVGQLMGKNWKRFRRGTWRKSEVRKKWSMKQGRSAQKFILPHWWTSVIWRMPNWRQSTKNTKIELYSEVILWKMILILCSIHWSRVISITNDSSKKSWISYPDCKGAQDKQQMHHLLIPR